MIQQVERDYRRPRWAVYKQSYRTTCTPDAEWQRCKLEALRYKWGGYKNGTRWMQALGDIGREWFPWMAGGLFWGRRG
jgi:hypothetical protein